MKDLIKNFKVDQVKESIFTNGKICLNSTGDLIYCIYGSLVNIIDSKCGKTIDKIETDDEITCLQLLQTNNEDDNYLITAHRNLLMKQWSLKKDDDNNYNKCTRKWKSNHLSHVTCMSFNKEYQLLATGSSDYTCKIWDIKSQYLTHNLKGSQGILNACLFYTQPFTKSIKLITASDDSNVRIYNLDKNELEATLNGHFSSVTYLCLFNEKQLLSSSRDNAIILWSLDDYKSLKTIPVYESIESIIKLPSFLINVYETCDKCFMTFGSSGLIKIWNVDTCKMIFKQDDKLTLKLEDTQYDKTKELNQCIIQAEYISNKNQLVLVTIDKLIVFYDLVNSQETFNLNKQYIGNYDEILDVCICNDDLLAMATNSTLIKVYNLLNWSCQLLKSHSDLIICLNSYSHTKDQSFLASSSKDTTINLWKLNTKTNLYGLYYTCKGHTQDVGALCFNRSSNTLKYLASGSIDTTIKMWSFELENSDERLKVKYTIKAHDSDINYLSISPNDKLIASASSDKLAKLWDVETGKLMQVYRGHKRGIWCVQFSPKEQLILTSSSDTTCRLWSIDDATCLKTFESTSSMLKVLFVSNGQQFISGSTDGLIKLWNIKTNECVKTYDEHQDKIWSICLNKSEDILYSGSADSKLIAWKNVTSELDEREREERDDLILNEQKLNNLLLNKKYKKALQLAILLNKPVKCYDIINEILSNIDNGKQMLEEIVVKLRQDHLLSLIKYSLNWNTNSKYCHNAQAIMQCILNNYDTNYLASLDTDDTKLIVEKFLPYAERHFSRLNKLMQSIMIVDFTWLNMKLGETRMEE